ncbi:conserved hypothetical protein [Histoplasma capsulatum G186AR]|uniref:Zn(2)-C6 fungal-type domain-containing protein n=1 Tax=Ajellomyces capsulatus (strain G186AR / H82 / ATCC MYA-2454 / RMSCC 2432) TaxID=447093 RepID=C0NVS4_AJECG|nr:uncharacterized protein HCBG_07254 [Histoplasma capsulatum G186AR]EEH04613.1 conserved hypothetical protein [Histoplasma capsulatum G186AR]
MSPTRQAKPWGRFEISTSPFVLPVHQERLGGGEELNYLQIPRAQDSQQLVQPVSKGGILEISLVVQSAKHVRCDEAAPTCCNCLKKSFHCNGAQSETLYKFIDPSQVAPIKTGVSSSHSLPYKDPTSPCQHSMDLQSGSTLHQNFLLWLVISSPIPPAMVHYSDIRGDICRGDENAPLAFIVFISEPVLQERLEYLKAHIFHLQCILRTFSENRFDGPLALPYALCLVKILRQHAGQQLSVKRLDDTIQFLSTRLRGLLSTPLLYTGRGRVSRASLLLQRQVFHERQNLPGDLWQRSTVLSFSMNDNLTVTLFLTNHPYFKVPDEIWNGVNSLDSEHLNEAFVPILRMNPEQEHLTAEEEQISSIRVTVERGLLKVGREKRAQSEFPGQEASYKEQRQNGIEQDLIQVLEEVKIPEQQMPKEIKIAQEVPSVMVDDSELQLAARRTREPPKNAGQIYCDHPDCRNHIPYFKRRSDWRRDSSKREEVDVSLFRL